MITYRNHFKIFYCFIGCLKKLVLSYELSWRTEEDKKFMKTTIWKQIRKKILARDQNTCHYCGVTRTTFMQINHIDGNPKNHSDDNLEVICSACHKITHSGLAATGFCVLDVYEKSNFTQNEIIQITGKMREQGKSDDEIISFLGLKNKVPWVQDLNYLSTEFGFISSRRLMKLKNSVSLTDAEQQNTINNRDVW